MSGTETTLSEASEDLHKIVCAQDSELAGSMQLLNWPGLEEVFTRN